MSNLNSSVLAAHWSWCPLSVDSYEAVSEEVKQVIEQFTYIRSERNLTADPQRYDELTRQLKALIRSIENRSLQIERFYLEKGEVAIPFEKLNSRLRRVLKEYSMESYFSENAPSPQRSAPRTPANETDGTQSPKSDHTTAAELRQRILATLIANDQEGEHSNIEVAAPQAPVASFPGLSELHSLPRPASSVKKAPKTKTKVKPLYEWEIHGRLRSAKRLHTPVQKKQDPVRHPASAPPKQASPPSNVDQHSSVDDEMAHSHHHEPRDSESLHLSHLNRSRHEGGGMDAQFRRPHTAGPRRSRPTFRFLRKGSGILSYSCTRHDIGSSRIGPSDDAYLPPFVNSSSPYLEVDQGKLWRQVQKEKWLASEGFDTTPGKPRNTSPIKYRAADGSEDLPAYLNIGVPYEESGSDSFPKHLREGIDRALSPRERRQFHHPEGTFRTAVPRSRTKDAYAKVYGMGESWRHV